MITALTLATIRSLLLLPRIRSPKPWLRNHLKSQLWLRSSLPSYTRLSSSTLITEWTKLSSPWALAQLGKVQASPTVTLHVVEVWPQGTTCYSKRMCKDLWVFVYVFTSTSKAVSPQALSPGSSRCQRRSLFSQMPSFTPSPTKTVIKALSTFLLIAFSRTRTGTSHLLKLIFTNPT